MKRILSMMLACILLVGCVFSLASCFSNVSEKYAEKINEAAKAGEHITYDEVLEALGDDAVEITVLKSGVIVAVKGCSTLDEIEDKLDEGKEVKGIVVTVLAGKATAAVYKTIDADDLK